MYYDNDIVFRMMSERKNRYQVGYIWNFSAASAAIKVKRSLTRVLRDSNSIGAMKSIDMGDSTEGQLLQDSKQYILNHARISPWIDFTFFYNKSNVVLSASANHAYYDGIAFWRSLENIILDDDSPIPELPAISEMEIEQINNINNKVNPPKSVEQVEKKFKLHFPSPAESNTRSEELFLNIKQSLQSWDAVLYLYTPHAGTELEQRRHLFFGSSAQYEELKTASGSARDRRGVIDDDTLTGSVSLDRFGRSFSEFHMTAVGAFPVTIRNDFDILIELVDSEVTISVVSRTRHIQRKVISRIIAEFNAMKVTLVKDSFHD